VHFPDVASFREPDRPLSATASRVGQLLEQGMDIKAATKEGDAESNMIVEREEDYNTRYAGYKGFLMAFERVKLIPRNTAPLDLTALVRAAGADTPDKVVDHLAQRFLRIPLAPKDRAALVGFLQTAVGSSGIQPGEKLEGSLRELLYLVLSLPEYQLG
jgi:hypothetical protein